MFTLASSRTPTVLHDDSNPQESRRKLLGSVSAAHRVNALNLALFDWLAAGHEPHAWLLPFASAVALGGSWVCAALTGWVAWRRPSQRSYIMAALVVAGATAMLSHAIAAALNLPRPFVVGLSPAYVEHGVRGSLPSAHASVMFATAFVFLLRSPLRGLGLAVAAVALLTGWARIYIGVHFPLDIAAGVLLAAAVTAVFALLLMLVRRYLLPLIAKDSVQSRALSAPLRTPGVLPAATARPPSN